MTDKLWYRSSDQSLVRPKIDEPWSSNYCGGQSNERYIDDNKRFNSHLASLPALTDIVIHPEYAATLSDGWVKVERVRWEIGYFPHPDEPMKWVPCTEKEYNEGYLVMVDVRRVLLAPVEKPTPTTMSRKFERLINQREDETGNTYPLQSQPTQQTGTGEREISEWLQGISTNMKAGERYSFAEVVDIIGRYQLQAASGSDAVEFADWLDKNRWEIDTREQVTHTTEQLYQLFKSKQPTT